MRIIRRPQTEPTGQQRILEAFGLPTKLKRGKLVLDIARARAVGPLRHKSMKERLAALESGFAYITQGVLMPVTRGGVMSPDRVANFTSAGTTSNIETINVDATGFTVGQTLAIGIFNRRASSIGALTSMTDTQGNAYMIERAVGGSSSEIITVVGKITTAIGAGDHWTLTWPGTVSTTDMQVYAWTGIDATTPVDTNPLTTANATAAPNGPAMTTTAAHTVLVAWFGSVGSVTVTAQAAGWSYGGAQIQSGGPTRLDSIWIEETAQGTYTPSVTYSGGSGTRQAALALTVGATLTAVGKSLSQPWTVKALAGKSLSQLWTVKALAGKSCSQLWKLVARLGKSVAQPWSIIAHLGVSLVMPASVDQVARPLTDITRGGWDTAPVASQALRSQIDEAVESLTDYIFSSQSPGSADVCEVLLSAVADPAVSGGHVIEFGYQKDQSAGDSISLTVRLMQGATQIVAQTFSNITASHTIGRIVLTGAQADAITDYANLRLRFEAVSP